MNCHSDRFWYEDIPRFLLSFILVPVIHIRVCFAQGSDDDPISFSSPKKRVGCPCGKNGG